MTQQFSRLGGIARTLTAAAAALAVLVAAPKAPAQFGPGGFREMMEPSINSKEIEKYAAILKMTPEQLSDARNLLDGFTGEYSAIAKEMQATADAARNEFSESRDPTVWRDLGKSMVGYGARIKKLEASYFDDVKLLLNDEQAAAWPKVERARRREHSLPRGILVSGETVDLFKIVDGAKLDAKVMEQVQPMLDQYEMDLDRALVERDRQYEEGTSKGMELWSTQQMDKIQELFDRSRDAAAKVREVNKKYAREIQSALPEGKQAAFATEVKKATFPRVYRSNYLTRSLDTADQLPDITPEQKTQLAEIRAAYEQAVTPMNDKLASSIEETEMKRTAMQMFGMGGPQNDGSREIRDQKNQLDSTTYDKIRGVLTDSQKAKLPERPQQNNWRNGAAGGVSPPPAGGARPTGG